MHKNVYDRIGMLGAILTKIHVHLIISNSSNGIFFGNFEKFRFFFENFEIYVVKWKNDKIYKNILLIKKLGGSKNNP